jgi:3-dehydroquinate dehydratase II
MAELLLLNGPNLNLLGSREPERYGHTTLAQLEADLCAHAERAGHRLSCFQSNHEGALIDRVHAAATQKVAWILLNPGGLTHTSVGLRDALLGVAIPFIEVHITNIHARESFRRHSYLADIASGIIAGLGTTGYRLALDAAIAAIEEP